MGKGKWLLHLLCVMITSYGIINESIPALAWALTPPETPVQEQGMRPVCPDASLSDERLCADALNAAQRYYIPRYRVAEEVVAGQVRYRIAFAPNGIGWTLTVYLVAYPAPAIEQASLMATPLLPAVQVALHYHDATGSHALPFQEVTQEIEGRQIKAVLQLDTLAARDAVYLALTDPTQAAQLRIQRRVQVWVAPQVTQWGATTSDLNLTLAQVSLNGSGSILAVDPGQSLTAQVNYHLWNQIDCPRCIDQVVVGVEADAQACADMGIPGTAPGVSGPWAFTLVAPTTPGVYAVRARLVQHYGCPQAQQVYENDGVNATQPIGLLLVGLSGLDQPLLDAAAAYVRTADLPLETPFLFPSFLYKYIFRALEIAPDQPQGLIQRTVAWEGRWYNYYQDAAERQHFYYLPDSFQLGRRSADGAPALSLSFTGGDPTAPETMQVQLVYRVEPLVREERIQAAMQALNATVGAGGQALQLSPLPLAQAVQFRLALPHTDQRAGLDEVRQGAGSLQGFDDRLNLALPDFQAVWQAIFSQGRDMTLFTGEVVVEIAGGYSEQIAFNGRLADDPQSVFDAILAPDLDTNTYYRSLQLNAVTLLTPDVAEIMFDFGDVEAWLSPDSPKAEVALARPIRGLIIDGEAAAVCTYTLHIVYRDGKVARYRCQTKFEIIYADVGQCEAIDSTE